MNASVKPVLNRALRILSSRGNRIDRPQILFFLDYVGQDNFHRILHFEHHDEWGPKETLQVSEEELRKLFELVPENIAGQYPCKSSCKR
jgi:hypothetical protein